MDDSPYIEKKSDTRVLLIGGETGTNVEDHSADWNDEKKIGDFDVVIFDLHDLEQRANEFDHPYFDTDDSVTFPDTDLIKRHIQANNDFVIRLPTEQTAITYSNEYGALEYNLLKWLPFRVSLANERGEKLVAPKSEKPAGFTKWRRFFGYPERFPPEKIQGWDNAIEGIEQTPKNKSRYTDPRPEKGEDEEIVRKAQRTQMTETALGRNREQIHVSPIMYDNLDRCVAASLGFSYHDSNGYLTEPLAPLGNVVLLPPCTDQSYTEFVQRVLEARYDFKFRDSVSTWVSNYPLPGEQAIQSHQRAIVEEVEELEQQVSRRRDLRDQLLNGQGDELEEAVRIAFDMMGFHVEGEIPGGRDGTIHTKDTAFILEVTGTSGGVSPGKIDKLERHMISATEDYGEAPIAGLLVYNHRRDQRPEERQLHTNNFRDDLLEKNQVLLPSVDLYHFLHQYLNDELERDKVESLLENSSPVIAEYNSQVSYHDSSANRITTGLYEVKKKLVNLLESRRP